jgi:hypothetical protein
MATPKPIASEEQLQAMTRHVENWRRVVLNWVTSGGPDPERFKDGYLSWIMNRGLKDLQDRVYEGLEIYYEHRKTLRLVEKLASKETPSAGGGAVPAPTDKGQPVQGAAKSMVSSKNTSSAGGGFVPAPTDSGQPVQGAVKSVMGSKDTSRAGGGSVPARTDSGQPVQGAVNLIMKTAVSNGRPVIQGSAAIFDAVSSKPVIQGSAVIGHAASSQPVIQGSAAVVNANSTTNKKRLLDTGDDVTDTEVGDNGSAQSPAANIPGDGIVADFPHRHSKRQKLNAASHCPLQ